MLSLPRIDGITPASTPASPLRPPQAVPPAPPSSSTLRNHPSIPHPAPRNQGQAPGGTRPGSLHPLGSPVCEGEGDLPAAAGGPAAVAAPCAPAVLQCPPRRRQPSPARPPPRPRCSPGSRGWVWWGGRFKFRPGKLKKKEPAENR